MPRGKHNKTRRESFRRTQAALEAAGIRQSLLQEVLQGTAIPVNKARVFSRCAVPRIPDFWRDQPFTCKLCGKTEVWTARQQRQWYEEQGGEIEAIAIHCHDCRRELRKRKAAARKVHLEGLERKRLVQTSKSSQQPQRGQT